MVRKRRSGKAGSHQSTCPICAQRALGGGEIYVLASGEGVSLFDVQKALILVSDGRAAHPVPLEMLEKMVQVSYIEPVHMEHVRANTPGLIGQRSSGPFLMDGPHRAARKISKNEPFTAFFLSHEETRACLLSQDVSETDIGIAAHELRRLLSNHPDTNDLEIEIDATEDTITKIRNLLSPGENRRISIRATRHDKKP